MSLQHLHAMGIQPWQLKSKAQTIYALVSDEECDMSHAAQSLLSAMLTSIDLDCESILTSDALKKQINTLQPRLLLILGSRAAHHLLNCDASIEDLRGRFHAFANIPTIITYHPEHLLRNPGDKRRAYQDLRSVQNAIMKN